MKTRLKHFYGGRGLSLSFGEIYHDFADFEFTIGPISMSGKIINLLIMGLIIFNRSIQ